MQLKQDVRAHNNNIIASEELATLAALISLLKFNAFEYLLHAFNN